MSPAAALGASLDGGVEAAGLLSTDGESLGVSLLGVGAGVSSTLA